MKTTNKYKILFSDLQLVSDAVQRDNSDVLVDYLNSFRGDNIFEKFKEILKCWSHDVAYNLNFNFDKPTKIQISYILSQLPDIDSNIEIVDDNVKMIVGIPKRFYNTSDFIPIYEILQYIKISEVSINLEDLSLQDKIKVIDSLPAKTFNTIINTISTEKSKIVSFDNPVLSKFHLNFLTNDPLTFLMGMFSNYDENYFRDVIFLLSKRVDGSLLVNSTPLDIEYYVDKYTEETESQNNEMSI